MAVTLGDTAESKQIGVGAAMGGPLVLATIAYGVTGWMLLARRRVLARHTAIGLPSRGTTGRPEGTDVDPMAGLDLHRLASDQRWFLSIFVVKVSLGLVTFAFKPWLGLAFFAAYGVYFFREMSADAEAPSDTDLEPLMLQPQAATPSGWAVAVQTLVALAVIFAASQLFVAQLEWAGPALGLPAALTALLLSPIATELPEVMNAVIWVRQGKTQLALANISGAMMIQATVPSGLGLLFTPWRFDHALLLSGVVTMAAIIYLLWLLGTRRFTAGRLALAAAFYGVFVIGAFLPA